MKKFLAVLTIVLMGTNLYAAFENLGYTAKSMSLGNAIFGDFDGVNSVNYNPASIALVKSIQIYGGWNTPYAQFNDGSMINTIDVNYVMPFFNGFSLSFDPFITKRAAIGIGVHRMSVVFGDMEIYHEGVYSFTYAKDLNDVISRGAKISIGFRLNIFDIAVGSFADVNLNPSLGGMMSRVSFGLDLGLTYDFSETIRLGLSYKNLIAPNISILPDGVDTLPSEFSLGANWNIGNILFMKNAMIGIGLITYGKDASDNRTANTSYNLGFEFKQLSAHEIFESKPFKGEILSVRMGAIFQQMKLSESVIKVTGGIGFMYVFGKAHQVNVDYAFEYGINNGSMKHVAGLTYQYLLPNSAFVYEKGMEADQELDELSKANTNVIVPDSGVNNADPNAQKQPDANVNKAEADKKKAEEDKKKAEEEKKKKKDKTK
ncbi:MAG: hypothetical protein A2Y33_10735 [Spirochaetes bacterium GWF1_51_8]|nr:MAG: hypothetical protein A2Y33_10735 [Spirochaetes bacterium GWF1_51_8]